MLTALEREMKYALENALPYVIGRRGALSAYSAIKAVIAKAEAKERETAQQAHERMLALRLAECPDDVEFYR